MPHEFKKQTLSLWNLEQLIKFSGREAKYDIQLINKLSEKVIELNQKITESSSNTELKREYEKTISKLIFRTDEVIKKLEEIKKFDRRLIHKSVNKIDHLIALVINNHLFKLLPQRASIDIKNKLFELMDYSIKIINDEKINEKRLEYNKKPKGTFWEHITKTNKNLARQEIKESTLINHLEDKEKDIYSHLNSAIQYMVAKTNNKESISVPEFERITGMILELIYTLKQEFHKEVNIEKKTELEEWRIETKIKELKKLNNKKLNKVLDKLWKNYYHLIKMDYHEVKKQKKLEKKQTGNMRKLITGSLIGINLFFGTMVPLHAGEISKSLIIPMITKIEETVKDINTKVNINWGNKVVLKNLSKENINIFIDEAVKFSIKLNKKKNQKIPDTVNISINNNDFEGVKSKNMGGYVPKKNILYLNPKYINMMNKDNKTAIIIFATIIHEMVHLIDYYNSDSAKNVEEDFSSWAKGESKPNNENQVNVTINYWVSFNLSTETNAMTEEIAFYNYLLSKLKEKDLNDEEKDLKKYLEIGIRGATKNLDEVKKGTYNNIVQSAENLRSKMIAELR